ncbi:glycosyltransferase family 4 protein [Verticiella sediminum]|uniref:Glycosyltransferase family 4 protein n=1 Tax=Verticiella sediminum TaxID=1247510 RepID=A0A556A894_9BURK|nr:glycosyltransferase [Verticiella sediminum]TSH89109.1 glycosyltransferase family 4 protein [Verticiella sediminum]
MRLVIDAQALQSATLTLPAGAWCVALLRELLPRLGVEHEVSLLLHRGLGAASEPQMLTLAGGHARLAWFDAPVPSAARDADATWRRQAARLARESRLQALAPDAVLLLNAAEGYDDDGVVSIRQLFDVPTLALLPAGLPQSTRAEFRSWRREVLVELRRADAVYTVPGCVIEADDEFAAHELPAAVAQAAETLGQALLRHAAAPRAPAAAPARPRLAYVSPLPPAASGIADYSAELLPALAEFYEIDLVPTGPAPEPSHAVQHAVRDPAWLLEHADRYDRVLYHVGNSPFHGEMVGLLRLVPGVVVLHDFYLGHLYGYAQHSGLVPMALWRALLRSHGYAALREYRAQGEAAVLARYPANLEVFGQAQGVIVHSAHARALAERWYGPALPCALDVVPLAHQSPARLDARAAARRRLGLAEDALLVCSFGYAGAAKLSRELVEAWLGSGVRRGVLALVGGHQFDGPYSQALEARVRAAASVRMTGFATPQVYRDYLAAADIAVQLRTGSRGETSRAVLDAMAHGAALIVNAHGSAAELPPDTVLRLDEDCAIAQIGAAIRRLADDPAQRAELARRARDHVLAEHAPQRVAGLYRDAIEAAYRSACGSAAGRARAVRAALARQPRPGVAPSRAELARYAALLLRNHPQPQARQIPVDFVVAAPQVDGPLRGLSLRAHPPREPRSGAEERARRMLEVARDAQIAIDTLHLSVALDGAAGGDETDWRLDLPGVVHASWPRRLREGLPVAQAAQRADIALRLAERLQAQSYDFVLLEDVYAWPLLRQALAGIDEAQARPAIVHSAAHLERASLPPAVPPAVAEEVAGHERELLQQADLVLCTDADARSRLVAAGASADRVAVIGSGGGLPEVDETRLPLIRRDHLPDGPYALMLSGDDAGARAGFLAFLGPSLAFMPPDATLVVAGALADALRAEPEFLRWRGVNEARMRLLGEVDVLMQAALLRYAHVIVLPRLPDVQDSGVAEKSLEALATDAWVLATRSAMHRLDAWTDSERVVIEDDWAGFRRRLVELLGRARPPRPRDLPGPQHWRWEMTELPFRLRQAVARRQRRAAGG